MQNSFDGLPEVK